MTTTAALSVCQADMLKGLFTTQKKYLDDFFTYLDSEEAMAFFQVLADCQGMCFFSGMGKSGIVARKIAMTMVSTGTRALYLSPTNALHGDMGIVGQDDVFVLLTRSGETEELLNLIPFIRNRGAKILGMVSKEDSRIAKACDLSVVLPVKSELCPFGLSPTTSAIVQMIFGDVMAVALMKAKGFSLDQYARNHPAGQIGKRSSIKVRDLMITGEGIPLCRESDSLGDVLGELSDKKCGCVLVVDAAMRLVGIFTDGDLRRSLREHGGEVLGISIGELMTPHPRRISVEAMAWEAARLMESDQKHPIMVLAVIQDEQPRSEQVVGLIKMHDIIQAGVT